MHWQIVLNGIPCISINRINLKSPPYKVTQSKLALVLINNFCAICANGVIPMLYLYGYRPYLTLLGLHSNHL